MNQHGIVVQGRHEPCTVCGARPECHCTGTPEHPEADDHPGCVHLCRPCLAAKHGALTYADAASVMHGDGTARFAGWDLVFDTAAAS